MHRIALHCRSIRPSMYLYFICNIDLVVLDDANPIKAF